MKICHITTVHKPKDARIFYRMCSALAAKGHEVTLIASAPFADEVGVHSSSWNERIAPAGRVSRIILALRAALSENADVYHFHDPELISLGLALKLVRPSKTVVYDVHEDYPSMMLDKYWIPTPVRPLISKAARMANSLASLCLDGIVTADLGVQSDFQRIAGERTLVYYNFPVPDVFRPSVNGAPIADLVYIGGMSKRTGMFVLLDALALLGREGIRPTVRLAGYTDGEAGRRQIVDGIKSRKLEAQIDFRGRMPHSEVPDWIRSGAGRSRDAPIDTEIYEEHSDKNVRVLGLRPFGDRQRSAANPAVLPGPDPRRVVCAKQREEFGGCHPIYAGPP